MDEEIAESEFQDSDLDTAYVIRVVLREANFANALATSNLFQV